MEGTKDKMMGGMSELYFINEKCENNTGQRPIFIRDIIWCFISSCPQISKMQLVVFYQAQFFL